MKSFLEMELETIDMDYEFFDRTGSLLPVEISHIGNLCKIKTNICLPNRMIIQLKKKTQTGYTKLLQAKLGHVKFNNDCLTKLFVYYHTHGHNRCLEWIYDGRVEFEFFEFTATKYHLVIGTQI